MQTADMLKGLLSQTLAGHYADMSKINAAIYAKASGLSAADLGTTTVLVINPPQEPSPVPPPPPTPAPTAAPNVPTPSPAFDLVTEQQQADGTWKEIARSKLPH